MTRVIRTVVACVLAFLVAGLVAGGGRFIETLFGDPRVKPEMSASPIDDRGIDGASAEIRFAGSGGGRRPLRVKISNRSRFPIKVIRIRVRVKPDRTHAACPPRKYVRKTRLRKPIRVARKRTRRVRLAIKLLYKAPDACQGAVFPLRVGGTAVRA